MNDDRDKSREQLIEELKALRQEVAEFKKTESKPREYLPIDKRQQINYEIIEQDALYRSLVEDHPYSVDLFLPDTTIIFVNKHLAESLGYTPEQLKGEKWIKLLPQERRRT